MKRRQFLAGVGAAAVVGPRGVLAQQTKPVVGFLTSRTAGAEPDVVAAFHSGLKQLGYMEGQNLAMEYRWAAGDNNRLPSLAADLVQRQVTAIAAAGVPAAQAAKSASATIPIAFVMATDPIKAGLVNSLSRPGGNLTGVTSMGGELAPKRLELLHALVPTATRAALLVNPTNPVLAEIQSRDTEVAARTLGLRLHVLYASTDRDLEIAFATLSQVQAEILVIAPDTFLLSRGESLARMSVRHAVPTIFQNREFLAAGGLMSYGTNSAESWRQFGVLTGRILRGEKPADLPVLQSAKVELFVNLKAAKALGLTVPLSLLGRADEVIE